MRNLVVFALASLLFTAGCSNSESETKPAGPLIVGLPFTTYAHEGEPFARDVFTEHATKVNQADDEELFSVGADTDLRFTHVDGVERRSVVAVEGAPEVWFFGGSTMFGIGQRDEHTIASEVAKVAADAGTPVTVRNFGWSSYMAWQEVGLLRRLVEERGAPDLLVFLHGITDYSGLCRHMAGGISPMARTNPLTDARLDDGPKQFDCYANPRRTGEVLAGVVDAAMLEAEAMAPGVPIAEFWQPAAYTRAPFPTEGELLDHMGVDAQAFDQQRNPYLAAIEVDRTPPIDLTDVFDEVDDPIFFDWAHTNELGARLLARAMWERGLQEQIRALA